MGHAEAVLFVDDDEPDVAEVHDVLEEGMGAHEYLEAAVGKGLVENFPFLFPGGTGEEADADGSVLQQVGYGLEVLDGQDFSGGHDAGLVAVVEGEEHAHEGHEGFSASHVALEKAVHLLAGAAVGADFPDDSFLGIGEGKGEMVVVEVVEVVAHGAEDVALEGGLAVEFELEDVELDVEEFLEFQPVLGLAQEVRGLGKVDVVEGIVEVDEVVPFDEPCREGFLDAAVEGVEDVGLDLGNELGGEVGLFHLFRGGVDGLEADEAVAGVGIVGVNLGVHDVHFLVEHGGFAEYDVFLVRGNL